MLFLLLLFKTKNGRVFPILKTCNFTTSGMFCFVFCFFFAILRVFLRAFSILRLHIEIKQSASKIGRLKVKKKKNAAFICIFENQIWWSASYIKTAFIMHVQEIGLCFNIFLGNWCIGSCKSSHRYKFEQRKLGKWKILPNTLWGQIRWSAFNFLHMFFVKLVSLRNSMQHVFSRWCIIFIKKLYWCKSEV